MHRTIKIAPSVLVVGFMFSLTGHIEAQELLIEIPDTSLRGLCVNTPVLDDASSMGFFLGSYHGLPDEPVIGKGVTFPVGETGSADFDALNDPQFTEVTQTLTNGLDDPFFVGADLLDSTGGLLPGGGGGIQNESQIFQGNPDLIGTSIEFIRLIVNGSSIVATQTPLGSECAVSQFGHEISWNVMWQIWGFPQFCGNQIVDIGEQCDDGNMEDGDGCSATCQLAPPLATDRFHCQKTIGSSGKEFLQQLLAARHKCLTKQLKGTLPLPEGIDCKAELTGDERTDTALTNAEQKIHTQLEQACGGVSLEALGFPSHCPDPDGHPFTSYDLGQCLVETHTEKAIELIGLEFPLP